MARVAAFGYTGLLGGPPIIGSLAHLVRLSRALVVLVVLMLAVVVLSAKVAPRRRSRDREPLAPRIVNRALDNVATTTGTGNEASDR